MPVQGLLKLKDFNISGSKVEVRNYYDQYFQIQIRKRRGKRTRKTLVKKVKNIGKKIETVLQNTFLHTFSIFFSKTVIARNLRFAITELLYL